MCTFEELEPPTSCINRRIVHRSIFTHCLATAVTIHAMSSVYFLCHFGTCCQSSVCSFLYMHFISEGSYGGPAKHQSDSSRHVVNRFGNDTSTTRVYGPTCDLSVTVLILGPPAGRELLGSYRIDTLPTR